MPNYVPRPIPRAELPEMEALTRYIERELGAISRGGRDADNVPLVELHAEPAKPRIGMVVYADGTDWDPGDGAGQYTYNGTTWNKSSNGGPLSNRTITGTTGEIEVTNGDGVSGNPIIGIPAVLDLGGNTSVEIPNGTAPTVDAAGEIAIDTNTDNSNITHGSIIFYDGTSVRYGVSVATLPSAEGQYLAYNGTSKRFEFYTPATQAQMETGTATNVAVTPGVQHNHPGHPKCWAHVTVSAGTPTLASSYNMTSITDTATGRLTLTIATDFSSTSWASFGSYANITANAQVGSAEVGEVSFAAGSKAAGSIILEAHEPGSGASGDLVDPTAWNFMGLGDQ